MVVWHCCFCVSLINSVVWFSFVFAVNFCIYLLIWMFVSLV